MIPDIKSVLHQVAEGDENAFRILFDEFSGKVFSFAGKLTHSETTAQEIVQDVFMKIWIHREALATVEFFPSYLYTITKNHAFNVLKRLAREQRARQALEKQLNEAQSDTEEIVIRRDHQHILNRVIDRLPPQQRLVYSLCHREGLKYEEVAERLHISRLTVKTHMKQALRTIRSSLIRTLATFLCIMLAS